MSANYEQIDALAVSSAEASKPPLDPLGWNHKKLTEAYDMEQLNVLYKYVQSNYSNPIIGDGPVENGLATSERFNHEGRKIVKALQQAQGVLYERYKAKREAARTQSNK